MKNKGHIHADLMAQYAEDAKTHSDTWKLWQLRRSGGLWSNCSRSPAWSDQLEYRHKPKTHLVNGVEIPDLRFTPEIDQHYCYPDPSGEELARVTVCGIKSPWHIHRIANNLCYDYSEEGYQAAILHAKAWLGIA